MDEGIIIDVKLGNNLRYGDEDNIYLALEIYMHNHYRTMQYFHMDNVEKVLDHFNVDEIHQLIHRQVNLEKTDNSKAPSMIKELYKDGWLFNDNNRKTLKLNLKDDKNPYNNLDKLRTFIRFFDENNVSGECSDYLKENIKELSDIASEELCKYVNDIGDD